MKNYLSKQVAIIASLCACSSALSSAIAQDDTTRSRSGSAQSQTGTTGSQQGAADSSHGQSGQLSNTDTQFIQQAAKMGKMEVTMGQLGKQKAQIQSIRQLAEMIVTDHTQANEELMQLAVRKRIMLNLGDSDKGGTSSQTTSGQSTVGENSSSTQTSSSGGASGTPNSSGDQSSPRRAARSASDPTSRPATDSSQGTATSDRPSSNSGSDLGSSGHTTPSAGSRTGQGTSLSSSDQAHGDSMESFQNLSGAEFDQKFVKQMIDDHQKAIALFERESKEGQDTEVKAFSDKTLPTLRNHLQTAQAAMPERNQTK